MSNSANKLSGQCLCGKIAYEADTIGMRVGNCHCSMCRKFHGAPYGTLADVPASAFRWLHGQELLTDYTAPNGTTRRFCSQCGTSLIFAPANDAGEAVELAIGTLDTAGAPKPNAHVYVGNKADWFEITDDLPQYVAGRGSERLK